MPSKVLKRKNIEDREVFGVNMPVSLMKQVRALAAEQYRTPTEVIRQAVVEYLEPTAK